MQDTTSFVSQTTGDWIDGIGEGLRNGFGCGEVVGGFIERDGI